MVKPFNFWLKNTQKKKKPLESKESKDMYPKKAIKIIDIQNIPLESKESKDMYPKKAIKIIDIQNITLKLKFQQFRLGCKGE